jgi:hypothetical protein
MGMGGGRGKEEEEEEEEKEGKEGQEGGVCSLRHGGGLARRSLAPIH